MKKFVFTMFSVFFLFSLNVNAQDLVATFGKEVKWQSVLDENDISGKPVNWFQVNTEPDTWRIEDDILVTEQGHENLTGSLESTLSEIEALLRD